MTYQRHSEPGPGSGPGTGHETIEEPQFDTDFENGGRVRRTSETIAMGRRTQRDRKKPSTPPWLTPLLEVRVGSKHRDQEVDGLMQDIDHLFVHVQS